ncbi:hypothetical protein NEHOM01_0648 [Nematocida homosporus]|uniref:uncharacterized protein n=1 Tax=Nematocida homosporus TaxID=1912981 RepID=UPI00222057DE|nr:uncharacterized protein NEHOM01_0648 [Nematocida homosporus]KAI5185143.1 hypothetical protein NEHOM01_0648 [Nematocida homosporus]
MTYTAIDQHLSISPSIKSRLQLFSKALMLISAMLIMALTFVHAADSDRSAQPIGKSTPSSSVTSGHWSSSLTQEASQFIIETASSYTICKDYLGQKGLILINVIENTTPEVLILHNGLTDTVTTEEIHALTKLLTQAIESTTCTKVEFIGFNYPTMQISAQDLTDKQTSGSFSNRLSATRKSIRRTWSQANTSPKPVTLLLTRCNAEFAKVLPLILGRRQSVSIVGCKQCFMSSLDWLCQLNIFRDKPLDVTIIQDSSDKITFSQSPRAEIRINLCHTNSQLALSSKTNTIAQPKLYLQMNLQQLASFSDLQKTANIRRLEVFGVSNATLSTHPEYQQQSDPPSTYLKLHPQETYLYFDTQTDMTTANPAQLEAILLRSRVLLKKAMFLGISEKPLNSALQFSEPTVCEPKPRIPHKVTNLTTLAHDKGAQAMLLVNFGNNFSNTHHDVVFKVSITPDQKFDKTDATSQLLYRAVTSIRNISTSTVRVFNTAVDEELADETISIGKAIESQFLTLIFDGVPFNYIKDFLATLSKDKSPMVLQIANTKIPSLEHCLSLITCRYNHIISLQISAADLQSLELKDPLSDTDKEAISKLRVLVYPNTYKARHTDLENLYSLGLPICLPFCFYYSRDYCAQPLNLPAKASLHLYDTTFGDIRQVLVQAKATLLQQQLTNLDCYIHIAPDLVLTPQTAILLLNYMKLHRKHFSTPPTVCFTFNLPAHIIAFHLQFPLATGPFCKDMIHFHLLYHDQLEPKSIELCSQAARTQPLPDQFYINYIPTTSYPVLFE